MIIIDGQVKRNLQEQVGYNAEQIDKIFELIDGLNIQDNLVKVDTASGVLTSQEMEVVSRDVAFIVYNNKVYVKSETSASEFIFKQVALTASDQGTYNILQSFRIVVTRASGAYAYSSNTVVSFYNKAEMDSTISGLNSSIAGKANLTGADFTGAVTATTLKQTNANFSADGAWSASTNWEIQDIYTRCEEINNVLYAVANVKLKRITSNGSIYSVGTFDITLPASIADKIYDMVGVKASSAKATACAITGVKATVYTAVEGGLPALTTKEVVLTVMNGYANNDIYLTLTGTGDSVNVDDVFYVTARIPLTLI